MSAAPMLLRSLRYGGIFAIAVAVVSGVVGYLISGGPGLAGGLFAAALAAVFLGLTAISILIAGRVTAGDPGSPLFFGIILGVWFLKLILFLVVVLVLRGQDWLDSNVFFFTVIIAVLGSLALDALAFLRTRTPLDVRLPGDAATDQKGGEG